MLLKKNIYICIYICEYKIYICKNVVNTLTSLCLIFLASAVALNVNKESVIGGIFCFLRINNKIQRSIAWIIYIIPIATRNFNNIVCKTNITLSNRNAYHIGRMNSTYDKLYFSGLSCTSIVYYCREKCKQEA